MEQLYGYFLYSLSLLTFGGIYAILCLGLNIQWGFTGLFNAGVAGFFAIGAYVSAILTAPESPRHLGGYDLPIPVGVFIAMVVCVPVAWAIGRVCIRLRSDYLAIATLGIAEIIRLVFKNELWATNGARGVSFVPKPFEAWDSPWDQIAMALVVLVIVALLYIAIELARTSPWGRLMAAIREDEPAALAAGKNVERFRLEAFVIGAVVMALGGAMMAHYIKFVDPKMAEPLKATFLVWVMLIAGGSGNNKGAILGAMLLWFIWSITETIAPIIIPDSFAHVVYPFHLVASWFLPEAWMATPIAPDPVTGLDSWDSKAPFLRVFLIGLALQIVLQKFSSGILPEQRLQSLADTDDASARAARSSPS